MNIISFSASSFCPPPTPSTSCRVSSEAEPFAQDRVSCQVGQIRKKAFRPWKFVVWRLSVLHRHTRELQVDRDWCRIWNEEFFGKLSSALWVTTNQEISLLYSWTPVWLVWIRPISNQFNMSNMNLNQSIRRSSIQWYFHLQSKWVFSAQSNGTKRENNSKNSTYRQTQLWNSWR